MGLDVELFRGDVEPEFICGLCHQVLLNPVTSGCEHRFCQTCVSRKLKSRITKSICPTCNAQLLPQSSDTTVEFKLRLLSLVIDCSHKCGQAFELGDLPDHMDVCPNAPVICEFSSKGCKKTVKRADLQRHMEECDYRTVECEACGHMTIYRELFTHQSKVRCLEKKLKQQIIRERKAASKEINRHREKLFRENARLDQQQRKVILKHAKSLNDRKQLVQQNKIIPDSENEYTSGIFMTESVVQNDVNKHISKQSDAHFDTRTPHSSRSGFALQPCCQCNKLYRPDSNHPQACRWHTGPMIEVFGGTCFACGRLDYQPGCATGYHRQ